MNYQIEIPESSFAGLRLAPGEFVNEMKRAAAVKWYELGKISQERAAELCSADRMEFIAILNTYKVSVIQYTEESLLAELKNV